MELRSLEKEVGAPPLSLGQCNHVEGLCICLNVEVVAIVDVTSELEIVKGTSKNYSMTGLHGPGRF
jgi:hypothetical protein